MLTVAALAAALARADRAAPELEVRLNAADARLGDGDTGTMLARLIAALAAVDLSAEADLGAAFKALAKAGAASTGSSLGTLIVTALLAAAKASTGQTALAPEAAGPVLAGVRDAVMTRGRAQPGDKTIVDSLGALAAVWSDGSPADPAAALQQAAAAALDAFRDRPCRVGRARMFAERSQGLDDPGMLAVALLAEQMLAPG